MNHTPAWLQSLLEEHFDEMALLWELRQDAMVDSSYSAEDVIEFDRRIGPHIDGLLLGGDHSLPILEAGLGGSESATVCSAALVLLRMRTQESAKIVTAALGEAAEDQIDGFCEALRQSDLELIAEELRTLYEEGSTAAAAIASEAFAAVGAVSRAPSRLAEYYSHDDPGVRRAGWRITALLD